MVAAHRWYSRHLTHCLTAFPATLRGRWRVRHFCAPLFFYLLQQLVKRCKSSPNLCSMARGGGHIARRNYSASSVSHGPWLFIRSAPDKDSSSREQPVVPSTEIALP